jgi:hypothetical protein
VVVLVLAWIEHRELARDVEVNLVTSPLDTPTGQPAATARHRRWVPIASACLVPAAYLAFAALGWLTA